MLREHPLVPLSPHFFLQSQSSGTWEVFHHPRSFQQDRLQEWPGASLGEALWARSPPALVLAPAPTSALKYPLTPPG